MYRLHFSSDPVGSSVTHSLRRFAVYVEDYDNLCIQTLFFLLTTFGLQHPNVELSLPVDPHTLVIRT
jgi:hypothetical protein